MMYGKNWMKPVLWMAIAVCMSQMATAAILTVTNGVDSGAGSLRQTILGAAPGDTIVFDPGLNGSIITLTSGALTITNSLTITGPGPQLLAINGNASDRVLNIQNPVLSTITVRISGLSITNGVTTGGGGGIGTNTDWNKPLRLTVSNCVIRFNRNTSSSYSGGGGISINYGTTVVITDSEISNNNDSSGFGGGGVWFRGYNTSSNILERVSVIGNSTSGSGGGLLTRAGYPIFIWNCTFSGNSSTSSYWQGSTVGGGAIFTQGSGITHIYNSTLTSNTATKSCGGFFSYNSSTVSLHSVILSGNTAVLGSPDVLGTFTTVTNCLIQFTNGVALPGANNIFGQPALLEALAYNGGLTRTHALAKNSPAFNKGHNPLNLQTDQRGTGYPRLLGNAVDIGAYELVPPPRGTILYFK